uniref:Endo-1,4-beta-xylanase n=1 Tax=Bursaphelenchus xylophilus TaxID=6326 RepID=A0A1I7RWW1_BURXY
MSKILILTGLIAVATAIESDGRFGAAPAAFGFDSTDALTPEIAGCLKNSGYSAAFFRIFSDGHGDMRGVENAVKASEAGIKLEFFVTPRAVRGDAKRQLDLLADFANQQKIGLKRVWLQVTSPHNWQRIWGHNVEFINDFITAGKVSQKSVLLCHVTKKSLFTFGRNLGKGLFRSYQSVGKIMSTLSDRKSHRH